MSEFYYESEVAEIMHLISGTTLGRCGVEDGRVCLVDHHGKTRDLKSSLDNLEKDNPLLDYKVYLLFESLFIFDWIYQHHSYIIDGVPIPLYCFKRGSRALQTLWHSSELEAVRMKQEYYAHIRDDMNHVPSVDGELAELELFIEHMRGLLDVEYIDSQLRAIGLSYNSLVEHILVPDWRDSVDVAKWNKVYTAEDWLHHSVL